MRLWTPTLLAVLCGCSDSGAASSDLDAAVPADADAAQVDPRLAQETAFWDQVAICGEWVEGYPTIAAMAAQSDAVVVGRITDATMGHTVQGDAAEDFYAEVNLRIEVDEVLRRTIDPSFELSLGLGGAAPALRGGVASEPSSLTQDALDSALATLQANLPRDPVVVLVRLRADIPDVYRLVNDRALWARTARGALDNPIADDECDDWDDVAARREYLGGARTLDALIEELRGSD